MAITFTASLASSKSSTLTAAAMNCYERISEDGHFDCNSLAISSVDDEPQDELAMVAVVSDNLAGACRMDRSRAVVESENSVRDAHLRDWF